MRKIIKLTEKELRNILKQVITETIDVGKNKNGFKLNEGLFDFFNKKNQQTYNVSKWDFSADGFAVVKKGDKKNIINKRGRLISPEWYDDISRNFTTDGFTIVKNDGKKNLMDKRGRLISPEWYDDISSYFTTNGLTRVVNNNKENYIDKKGRLAGEWKEIPKISSRRGTDWDYPCPNCGKRVEY